MEKLKRRIAILGIFIALCAYCISEPNYSSHYEILNTDSDAFAKYSCGNIYIGDEEFLNHICCQEGDLLVEDQRCLKSDPNMKIYASCLIQDADVRNEILEVLQEYEKMHPSDWDRTIESMRLEWLMHNLSYSFSYEQNRTADVDLNNADEEYYDYKILQKIFHTS